MYQKCNVIKKLMDYKISHMYTRGYFGLPFLFNINQNKFRLTEQQKSLHPPPTHTHIIQSIYA
jgi:hypothetical protein